MEINIRDDDKIVEIWLTRSEKNDAALSLALRPVCEAYKSRKYLVALFKSGEGSLFEGTRDLLLRNRAAQSATRPYPGKRAGASPNL